MKTTTRTPRNGSSKSAPTQAATPPDSTPAEFKVVRLRECPVASAFVNSPSDVEKFWRAHVETAPWFKADKECLVVFVLNTRRNLLGFEMLSQGTKDTLLVNVGEVFRMAAMKSAAAIIVAHNHPSGNPTPSEADITVTRDLIRAGVLLKIEVLDHIIIGTPLEAGAFCHQSLRGLGYFDGAAGGAGEQPAALVAAVQPNEPAVLSFRNLPPLKRENVIVEDRFDMEYAIPRAVALVQLMARTNCTITERQKDSYAGQLGMGMMSWARDLMLRLERDWRAANDLMRGEKQTGAAAWPAIRKLGNTVEKVQAFLMMLAHDLNCYDYSMETGLSFEPAEDDIAHFLSLASDCVDYLKASFYHEFGRHLPMDEIDRKLWSELLAKFPQAEQERRAA